MTGAIQPVAETRWALLGGAEAPLISVHAQHLSLWSPLGYSHGFFPKPPNQKLLHFVHSFIIIAINSPYEQKINSVSKHFQGIISCRPIITQKIEWVALKLQGELHSFTEPEQQDMSAHEKPR